MCELSVKQTSYPYSSYTFKEDSCNINLYNVWWNDVVVVVVVCVAIYLGYEKLSALALYVLELHKILYIPSSGLNVVRVHRQLSKHYPRNYPHSDSISHSIRRIYSLILYTKRYLLSFYGFVACVLMMYNTFTHPYIQSSSDPSSYSLNNCDYIRWLLKGLFAAIDRNKGFDLGLMVVARA